jgi:hypothetical protein
MIWGPRPTGRRGRRQQFRDAAIQTCLTMKVLLGLPLRQTTGFVRSLLRMVGLDWAVPDFSPLYRRRRMLNVSLPEERGSPGFNRFVQRSPLPPSVHVRGGWAIFGLKVRIAGWVRGHETIRGENRWHPFRHVFAGNFAPGGWALCDGQLLPNSAHNALFSILGSTFAMPDLRARVLVHVGNCSGPAPRSLGQRMARRP